MKTKPILFSAPMVQALLEGRKTQTRRAVKPQPSQHLSFRGWYLDGSYPQSYVGSAMFTDKSPVSTESLYVKCPYGKPGDLLWVRETFGWHEAFAAFVYRATDEPDRMKKWKPSIFMPRAASRLTLEITSVRVERLLDISEADAKAEGTPVGFGGEDDHVEDFICLWNSINGAFAAADNPWVWVVEFKVHHCNVDSFLKQKAA